MYITTGTMEEIIKPSWARFFDKDEYGYWANLKINEIEQYFRWIEAGEFVMGSGYDEFGPDDEYPHKVRLTEGYWLADTACTQELWQLLMGANPSRFQGKDLPVENISCEDVDEFLIKLNYLLEADIFGLPTEAQWEYACRAGTDTEYYYGNCANSKYMNTDRKIARTVKVKSFDKNSWGLYQMHGNVFEYCSDWWLPNWCRNAEIAESKGVVINPISSDPKYSRSRIMRGGSWFREAWYSRSACRRDSPSCWKSNYIGFRLYAKAD